MTGEPGVAVVGAGGHGAVVCDVLLSSGRSVSAFVDDSQAMWGTTVLDIPVVAPDDLGAAPGTLVIVGIGDNAARRAAYLRFRERGYPTCAAVHPSAVLGTGVRLGPGTVVMAGVIVNARTQVDENAVLNTGCRVDHDCTIRAHAHIAPGATLTGGITVGEGALLGAGCVILPGVTIGAWAVVGAGAVVTRDVAARVAVTGVPARPVRS